MPKTTYNILGFHGGVNNSSNARDIDEIECVELIDAEIQNKGSINTRGSFEQSTSNANTGVVLANRGLFVMDADRKVSDNSEADASLVIVYDNNASSSNRGFDVFDTSWSINEISLDTNHPVFYVVDGILRVGDGALAENGKWYGYIGETKFASLRPAQAVANWISSDQNISIPSSGRCLIANSNVGSDGDTVNSLSKEYDGSVVNNSSSSRVVEHSSVNLRVGFPFKSQIQNTKTDWEINSGSPSNCTLSEPAETVIYPATSNNVILATGTTGFFHRIILNKSDSGVDFNFNLSSNQSLILGLNISETELLALDYMYITLGTGTGGGESVSYRFDASELIHSHLNILVCSSSNITSFGSNADLDNDIEYIIISAYQPSTSDGNDAPDIYYHMPMVVENPLIAGFQPSEYEFHYTFLYDDSKQESLPFKFNDVGNTFHANKVNILGDSILLDFDAYILPFDNSDNYAFNKRINGSRLYYTQKENDNYFLIGELDFIEKGFKFFPESDTFNYDIVNTSHTDNLLAKAVIAKDISPDSANVVDTYKTINGFGSEVKSLNAKYKTAVVHGRRVYVGNIEKDGKKHSDRMIKSRVNKFDTFPSGIGVVDVAIRDGESIVKLEAFADRILQFKQKSLYVINVSENVDFLEDVYRNKGCLFDYHVTKTDFGIAWFNLFGVYFYNGRAVENLFEKDGKLLIKKSEWENFITNPNGIDPDDTTMENAHIAYIPKNRQLFIKSRGGGVYIYDFLLRAWTTHQGAVSFQTAMSNFALNSNQELIYIYNNNFQIAKWNPDSSSVANFKYVTKDIDFGQPAVRKKVYKVYVTYKSNGASNVSVKYDINGAGGFSNTFKDMTDSPSYFTSDKLLDTSSSFKQAVLKPTTSSVANNIYSFQLRFEKSGSNVPNRFEIDDITIVYRIKNPK